MIFPEPIEMEWELETGEELLLYRDYAFDFVAGRLKLRGGRPYMVEGADALKFWVYHALATARYCYAAYGRGFGQEFADVSGEVRWDVIQADLERMISEALTVSPYITDVQGFVFTRAADQVRVQCTVATVYGEIAAETEVVAWEY